MDFDKVKFLTLSPKSQQKFIEELSQLMKETSVTDDCPSTPPQQKVESKRLARIFARSWVAITVQAGWWPKVYVPGDM